MRDKSLDGRMFLSLRACRTLTLTISVTIMVILAAIGCDNKATLTNSTPDHEVSNASPSDTESDPVLTQIAISEESPNHNQLIISRDLLNVEQAEIDTMVKWNNAFAFTMYQKLKDKNKNKNLIVSPYAISMAIAMMYTGTDGETAGQIQDSLQLYEEQERLPVIFNALDLSLAPYHNEGTGTGGEVLHTSAASWGQIGYPVQTRFLDLVSAHYSGPIQALDFHTQCRESEEIIEEWIVDSTDELMSDAGISISERVRFAFAAAAALNGEWAQPFDSGLTAEGGFKLLDGRVVTVPIMAKTSYFSYLQEEGYGAIDLSFKDSNLSLLLLLPESDHYSEFEDTMNNEEIGRIVDSLQPQRISLNLPKFSFIFGTDLKETLSGFGITDIMVEGRADFSGINKSDDLYLNSSRCKAITSIVESGAQMSGTALITLEGREEIPETESGSEPIGYALTVAKSTATHIGGNLIFPPKEVSLSQPFIFIVRDTYSGAIIFLGRVMNPKN